MEEFDFIGFNETGDDRRRTAAPLNPTQNPAEWLAFWNDEVSEAENLRHIEYWLQQAHWQQAQFL